MRRVGFFLIGAGACVWCVEQSCELNTAQVRASHKHAREQGDDHLWLVGQVENELGFAYVEDMRFEHAEKVLGAACLALDDSTISSLLLMMRLSRQLD
jgi:hypothetical protein